MNLTDDNFLLYCAKYYENPQCHDVKEFMEDLKRVKYIKKLLTRYDKTKELKDRLILNHIIVLNNVFGPEHVTKILLLKVEERHWVYLKPFLVLLEILPPVIDNIDGRRIYTDEITMDLEIVEVLRNI